MQRLAVSLYRSGTERNHRLQLGVLLHALAVMWKDQRRILTQTPSYILYVCQP